jgi:uncharacterized ion transporter superfamily protein YfcC
VLVWVAALFIPSGVYKTAPDGSPIPGTYHRVPSPLSFGGKVSQLLLSPVNGTYELKNPTTGVVDTETLGHLFGQIGVIFFIMAIGAFLSVSFSTRALDTAVGGLANRLRSGGWLLIAAVMCCSHCWARPWASRWRPSGFTGCSFRSWLPWATTGWSPRP